MLATRKKSVKTHSHHRNKQKIDRKSETKNAFTSLGNYRGVIVVRNIQTFQNYDINK